MSVCAVLQYGAFLFIERNTVYFLEYLRMFFESKPGEAAMTNQEKIEKVNTWQTSPYIHPLTCGNDSMHADLEPKEEDGEVKLVCVDCGYTQEIPDLVLQADLKIPSIF